MAAKYKRVGDLIDRLEMRIEAELATPEYLSGIEQQLQVIAVSAGPEDDRYNQYVQELQSLVYGTQGKDEQALKCLAMAIDEAGSPKKLRSRLLRGYARGRDIRHTRVDHTVEVFEEPVAKRYTILYWYSFIHIALELGNALWVFIVTRPWTRYTNQYIAKHHLDASVQFLQVRDKTVLAVIPVALIGAYVAIILTKEKKNIVAILKLFLILDLFGLLSDIRRAIIWLFIDILLIGLLLLVLGSLSKREPDVFKLLGLRHERRKEEDRES